MPYDIKESDNKFCVYKRGTNNELGCHDSREEAQEQIIALNIVEGDYKDANNLLNLTTEQMYDIIANEEDDTIYVEGYLFRYNDGDDKTDRDLDNQWWSKDTYLMTETFPIKGMPIMYGHSMENELTKIGIGVVTFAEENDIGLFIKGQLHKREKWRKIVEEVNKRRKYGLTQKQVYELADNGYNNIKSIVQEIPLQWSMGSYPPTYLADKKSGKIERAGIVEATLTPIPAEPIGTNVNVQFKSFVNFLNNSKESRTKESSQEDIKNYIIGYLKSQGVNIKMADNMEATFEEKKLAILNKAASDMAKVMADEAEKALNQEEVDEEEKEDMKSIILDSMKDIVEKDTGFKKAFKEQNHENLKSIVNEIIDDRYKDILAESVKNYMDKKTEQTKQMANSASGAFKAYRGDGKENPKSNKSGATEEDANDKSFKGFKFGDIKTVGETPLADFFKSVALRETPEQIRIDKSTQKAYKDQNPYIGTLGGHLLGQTMSQSILDPLRAETVTLQMGVTETRTDGIGVYTVPKMTTAPTAYRPGINQTITPSDGKFDTITAFLRPLAAQIVIPRQLLMQTQTNVEQKLREQMIKSMRLQIDLEVLEGVGAVTGSNTGAEIKGIKRVLAQSPVASTNLVTLGSGNGAKPKYDDLINAETRIAIGNVQLDQSTSGWIMHPRDRGTFRRTTGTDGHPLLYPNYSDRPYEDLIGYKVATTTQIDNAQTVGTSTDCSDIYFGNWQYAEYVIGSDIEVILDESTLADQLQIRFIAYMYSDFIVHYPEAFYVMSGVRA